MFFATRDPSVADNPPARGFHMTFDSGYTISVQWGAGNYCTTPEIYYGQCKSETAEVAIWNTKTGKDCRLSPHDTVRGGCSPDDVAYCMAQAQCGKIREYPVPNYDDD